MPHISYDIDGDGYVSQVRAYTRVFEYSSLRLSMHTHLLETTQEDYFLAKRFDLDGNGLLDPDEQEVSYNM